MQATEQLNQTLTDEQIKLMEISIENFAVCFDPYKTLSKEKLFELIDKEVDINYYVTLFIMNTIDKLPKDYEITVEMISKIGKYLRNYGGKDRRQKLFTELSNEIREMCLNFTPILESKEFLSIWTKLLEFGLKQKQQDLEDGTYFKELELVENNEQDKKETETETETIIETQTETETETSSTDTEIEIEAPDEKQSI